MNNREITAKQGKALIAEFLIGSSLISGGTTAAKQDSWICIVLAFVLILPMLWVYSEILSFSPGKNFYEIAVWCLGKIWGKAVCVIYFFYATFLGAFALRVFSEFMHVVNMLETPLIVIISCMILSVIYLIKKRLYVLGRLAKFVLAFLLISVSITVILSIKDMDFSNIKPVLHNNLESVLTNTFLVFSLPMGQSVLCMPVFVAMEHNKKVFPIFFKGALIAAAILLTANLRNLLVLGYSSSVFAFTSYEAVSVIAVGEFFTRTEVFIAINLLLAGFFKLCVSLFSSSFCISKVLNLNDYVPLTVPCGLLIMTLAVMIHSNNIEMFSWLKYHPLFCFPFQVIIPIVLLIAGKIKKRVSAGKKLPKIEGKSPEAS